MAASVSTGDAAVVQMKVLSQAQAETKSVFEPLSSGTRSEPPANACGRPSVTLQRQGEVVTGIRVECGCGQVIELACTY
jgi:hypothetical protein